MLQSKGCIAETIEQASGFHPLAIGRTVVVLRFVRGEPPFIEGKAVVKAVAPQPHRYFVQFNDDPGIRERLVRPEFQNVSENMLSVLLDLWRAEQALSASFADFFPPTNHDD